MLARKLSLDEHALNSMEEDALLLRGNVDFMPGLERTLWFSDTQTHHIHAYMLSAAARSLTHVAHVSAR